MAKHGEDFGVKLLQKYGWTEGKGLGAKEDGMSDALKPTLKFDKHGLGHDISKDIAFNWWDGVFNKALHSVGKSEEENTKEENEDQKKKKTYSNFVKRSKEEKERERSKEQICTLSNEMVEECEGRTAHKGARHGIYSSGKLERLKRADEQILQTRVAKKSKRIKREANTESISITSQGINQINKE